MNTYQQILLFCHRRIRQKLRNPVFLIMGIISPMLYLLLFVPLLGNCLRQGNAGPIEATDLFLPGMLVIMAFSGGIFSGFGIIEELRSGIIDRFRAAPVSKYSYLIGSIIHDLTFMLLQVLLFICFALPFGFHVHLLGIFVLMLLLACLLILTSALGHALGFLMQREDCLAPIVHGLNLPILLLSGVLLPMSFAPFWLKDHGKSNERGSGKAKKQEASQALQRFLWRPQKPPEAEQRRSHVCPGIQLQAPQAAQARFSQPVGDPNWSGGEAERPIV